MKITTDVEYEGEGVSFHDMVVAMCGLCVSPHVALENSADGFDEKVVLERAEKNSSKYFSSIKKVVLNATEEKAEGK